uniref:Uncharacterized protein n=1 Tax=Peronospora matthiolae TaxID=2874970 RepID=A0AAV1T768_9STRA
MTTLVEIQYRLFMYSSTEPDTLRPVVRLGTFEHVVSPSRPEEQEVDYEVMARDNLRMAHWDYRSGNRTPSLAPIFLHPRLSPTNLFQRESSVAQRTS